MIAEVVEVLVCSLVDDPNAVDVSEVDRRRDTVYLEVACGPGDTGKIIGRQGRIANAIRDVANTVAARESARVKIDIVT